MPIGVVESTRMARAWVDASETRKIGQSYRHGCQARIEYARANNAAFIDQPTGVIHRFCS